MSWTVKGVCTTLEKGIELKLCEYDIISINEAKTTFLLTLSGYESHGSNVAGSAARGGTVVLVKSRLSDAVFGVDASIGDQVWIRMRKMPGVLLRFTFWLTVLFIGCLFTHRREIMEIYV